MKLLRLNIILSLAEHIAEKIDGSSSSSGSSTTSKTTPTLTASKTQWSAADFYTSGDDTLAASICALTYNGDGNFTIDKVPLLANLRFRLLNHSDKVGIQPYYRTDNPPTFPITFNVGFTETETYKVR